MNERARKRILNFLAIAAGLILVWLLYRARWGILLVYVSALIATGFLPLIRWIERQPIPRMQRKPPRWVAALMVYAGGMLAVALVIAMVIPPAIEQGRLLVEELPSLFARAEGFLGRRGLLPAGMSLRTMMEKIPQGGGGILTALGTFWSFLGGVGTAFVAFVLSYYFILEFDQIRAFGLSFVPRERRSQVASALEQMVHKVGAWMLGQLMLCLIIGATSGVALGLLGVPYFYVLAVIAALGEFIPYAGPLFAAIPSIALALTQSWQVAAGVAAFYFVQQQVENQLLVPKLMQHQVGLSPAVVIVAIILGSSLLGVLGAILAIPTAGILQIILKELRRDV